MITIEEPPGSIQELVVGDLRRGSDPDSRGYIPVGLASDRTGRCPSLLSASAPIGCDLLFSKRVIFHAHRTTRKRLNGPPAICHVRFADRVQFGSCKSLATSLL